jgi:hypothetical protein
MFPITHLRKPNPKSKFTEAEDDRLCRIVSGLGTDDWHAIARLMPGRNPRQCRDRWLNYLSPEVTNGPWTAADDQLLAVKYSECGAAWRHIATFFPMRTDINVKSRWQLMQRRARKAASRASLQAAPGAAAVSADPPPCEEADIWGPLLMNDEAGMACLFDQWF